MDAWLIVVLVVAAVVVVALLALAAQKARTRRTEHRRTEAGEHYEEARVRQLEADRRTAEAQ
ncbi:MAG TPA: hypothetical protein VE395_06675, partial [Acidimicrobiales bacterium]|nr:hypothetical protein [Acidimicrobiales bacterium]